MVLNNQLRQNMITNKKYSRAYDIVPIELTSKVEIDFGNGHCLTKVENITKMPYLNIGAEKVVKLISEQLPELLVASETTDICGFSLADIIKNIEAEKKEWEHRQNMTDVCYTCEPCQA